MTWPADWGQSSPGPGGSDAALSTWAGTAAAVAAGAERRASESLPACRESRIGAWRAGVTEVDGIGGPKFEEAGTR